MRGKKRPQWSTGTVSGIGQRSFTWSAGECDVLAILGQPVMESWESPYMIAMAKSVCAVGGRILEVGFGLGISAAAIDSFPGVVEHVIFEANEQVCGQAGLWSDGAARPTTVYQGFWQDLVDDFPPESFDGILFDCFPLTAAHYRDGEVVEFFPFAHKLLRRGGIFAFYFDCGSSWAEAERGFLADTQPLLEKIGFSSVRFSDVPVSPRKDCPYFWKDRFLLPVATK
mmetsp:Transcript_71648/g.191175  ORF Transcript_71648/g.191175 Transcript_71648/m.191175 type:complete len:227 (-) Transcript_71648:971-1651(-)